MMRPIRLALVFLLLTGLVIGAWATFAPDAWYRSFPAPGHHWVSIDGPFNLHLVRDVGAAYLAMAALSGLALLWPDQVTHTAVGIATLFFNVPHLLYHLTHLTMYPPVDAVSSVLALGAAALCSLWLAVARAPVRR